MLGAQHNGFDAQWGAVVIVFNRDLALGIRTQVRHLFSPLADVRKLAQQTVAQLQRQRHEVVRFAARVPKHHALVARPLVFWGLTFHALVDVRTLLVDGTQHPTRRRVKLVLALRVTDARDGVPRDLLHVEVRLRLHLPGQHHLPCGHQRLASHLRLRIKRQKVIDQRIRHRIGDLVWVTF